MELYFKKQTVIIEYKKHNVTIIYSVKQETRHPPVFHNFKAAAILQESLFKVFMQCSCLKINMTSLCINYIYALTSKLSFMIKVFVTGLIFAFSFVPVRSQ